MICTTFRSDFHVDWKNQNKHSTLNSSFDALSKWHEPDKWRNCTMATKLENNLQLPRSLTWFHQCAACFHSWQQALFSATASTVFVHMFEPCVYKLEKGRPRGLLIWTAHKACSALCKVGALLQLCRIAQTFFLISFFAVIIWDMCFAAHSHCIRESR